MFITSTISDHWTPEDENDEDGELNFDNSPSPTRLSVNIGGFASISEAAAMAEAIKRLVRDPDSENDMVDLLARAAMVEGASEDGLDILSGDLVKSNQELDVLRRRLQVSNESREALFEQNRKMAKILADNNISFTPFPAAKYAGLGGDGL